MTADELFQKLASAADELIKLDIVTAVGPPQQQQRRQHRLVNAGTAQHDGAERMDDHQKRTPRLQKDGRHLLTIPSKRAPHRPIQGPASNGPLAVSSQVDFGVRSLLDSILCPAGRTRSEQLGAQKRSA